MQTVTSKDGTRIAYESSGSGPALILVGGAFSERAFSGWIKLAAHLAERFTVINYDRRGRGDSADQQPYAIEREIEDLEALIHIAGGSPMVFGMSSGAVLALRAAASGLNISKLALYEPPFVLDANRLPPADFASRLQDMVDANRRNEAVRYFMTKGMGVPAIFIWMMRFSPAWSRLKAVAHTLPYDITIMGDTVTGNPASIEPWRAVTTPTFVIDGEKSPESLRSASQALAQMMPNARYSSLEGQSHNVSMDVLASALKENLS
ncbi:MAG: alpha/beta hydrolase [Anaerolineae bacterium]|nr:alpha/beta hydrolase [Anaerolineae bacterium]